ncbi:MAG: Psp operon transcriptional activator, partial [Pseudomonadota bacterium]
WTPIATIPEAAQNNGADVDEAPRHSTDFSAISEAQIKIGDFRATTEAFEKALLEQALAQHRYNQRQTAKALNLSYDQLRHSLKKHDLLG